MKKSKLKYLLFSVGLTLALSACAGNVVKAPVVPQATPIAFEETELLFQEQGHASWYGPGFYGRKTASGERFTKTKLTAAHKTLPFGTRIQVTNLQNGKEVEVVINDRGPYIRGRVIDLSYAAAEKIGLLKSGAAPVVLKKILIAKK